jgi:acyl dehydratase
MTNGKTNAHGERAGATPIYLDDLHVGQRFTGARHTVDAQQITAFAAQFDPQPFHLDAAAARASLFGGLVASGWHTASLTMRLLVDATPIAGGLVGAGCEIAWLKPTRPGDILEIHSEVVDIKPSRSRPERGSVSVRCETRNQHGDVLQVMTARLSVPRRPPR